MVGMMMGMGLRGIPGRVILMRMQTVMGWAMGTAMETLMRAA